MVRRFGEWLDRHAIVLCLIGVILSIAVPAVLRRLRARHSPAPPAVGQPVRARE
jgi:hypothetical protein